MTEPKVETANVVASAAHDLRSPLNAVIGFSRLLLKGVDGPLSELQAADLEAIHANGQTMLRMLDSLIDLAKAESGWLSPAHERVYLHPLLDRAALLSQPAARQHGVQIRYEVDHAPPVRGDAQLIQSGFERLLDAALPLVGGGQIEIAAAAEGQALTISLVGTNPAGLSPNATQSVEAYRSAGASQEVRIDAAALYLITSQRLFALNGAAFSADTRSDEELRVTVRFSVAL
ncbi:MAG: HAMP domain-containing histidine kinase [Anaerolineae bacterium]|nr:HAMP domain-containing histidine kinase [Anaerolineae bacterium]